MKDCCEPQQPENVNVYKDGVVTEVAKFSVAGMDCADEISAIQKALALTQVYSVKANLMSATVEVHYSPSLTREHLKQLIESTGVRVVAANGSDTSGIGMRRLVLVGSSGIALAIGLLWDYFLKGLFSEPTYLWRFSTNGGRISFPESFAIDSAVEP